MGYADTVAMTPVLMLNNHSVEILKGLLYGHSKRKGLVNQILLYCIIL